MKKKKKFPSIFRGEGQGLVEFALTLPIILVLLLGIIEVGRLLFFYMVITNASREAVRYGSATGETGGALRYFDCDGIENAALALSTITGLSASDISISYDSGPDTATTFATCTELAASSFDVSTNDRIVVTVNYMFTPLIHTLGLEAIPSFPIISTSSRTIMKEISLSEKELPTSPPPTPDPSQTGDYAPPVWVSGAPQDSPHCRDIAWTLQANPEWSAAPTSYHLSFDGGVTWPATINSPSDPATYFSLVDALNGELQKVTVYAVVNGNDTSMLTVNVFCSTNQLYWP